MLNVRYQFYIFAYSEYWACAIRVSARTCTLSMAYKKGQFPRTIQFRPNSTIAQNLFRKKAKTVPSFHSHHRVCRAVVVAIFANIAQYIWESVRAEKKTDSFNYILQVHSTILHHFATEWKCRDLWHFIFLSICVYLCASASAYAYTILMDLYIKKSHVIHNNNKTSHIIGL